LADLKHLLNAALKEDDGKAAEAGIKLKIQEKAELILEALC
jgi:hypothetical protein